MPERSYSDPGRALTVLVVDDDPLIRLLIADHLQSNGHVVMEAEGAQAGMSMLQQGGVDLVLLDLDMPEVDGMSMLRLIRQHKWPGRLPVIVISASDSEDDIIQALEAGADDYMPKPIHHRILDAKLANFARRIFFERKNAKLLEHLEHQRSLLLEQISQEKILGGRIQNALLTNLHPYNPAGVMFSSRSEAAAGANGDFLEVITLGEDIVDVIAGDVMGKGMLAALVGAEVKQQISRTLAEQLPQLVPALPSPQEVVNALHKVVTPKLISIESFVTLVYCRIYRREGLMHVVTCGHLPLICVHGGQAITIGEAQLPLGVLEHENYTMVSYQIEEGDVIVAYSDGVIEAQDSQGEQYGFSRLQQAALAAQDFCATPGGVLEAIRNDVLQFADPSKGADDLTLLVLRPLQAWENHLRFSLERDLASIPVLRAHVEQFLADRATPEVVSDLRLVAVELFTNIVRHSPPLFANSRVEFLVHVKGDDIQVAIESSGPPFIPPEGKEPIPEPTLDRTGGFGLHIIKSLTRHLVFRAQGGVNKVVFVMNRCRH